VPKLVQFGSGPLSLLDPTQAPPGKHTTYAWHVMPLNPDLGGQRYDQFQEEFADKIIETWARYCPNMTRRNIIARHIYTARDYARELINMRSGDIFMGAFNADQVMYNHFGYRTPIPNLYYAGSAAHPGGAISGGAPLGARLGHFYRGVGLTIYEGYGLTETSAAITVNRIDDVKVGSVGKLLPGNSMRLNDDDELLVEGGVVFGGYWHNDEETKAVFSDGWFHTGDLGAIDDDGFLTIIGRKKEIIVTAGGKNVAPAILEDRLRAHPLISQAMAVGDAKPFIAALITIDPEAFGGWKQRNGKDANATVADLATDPDLMAEVELAIKDANQAVSKAEAIRKFRILPVDFTEDTGELTPTLKVKRNVVNQKYAELFDALYAG